MLNFAYLNALLLLLDICLVPIVIFVILLVVQLLVNGLFSIFDSIAKKFRGDDK